MAKQKQHRKDAKTKKLDNKIKRVAKAVITYDQERKFADNLLMHSDTPIYSGANALSPVWLTQIAGGSGVSGRIGNSIKLIGLELRGFAWQANGSTVPGLLRLMVVRARTDVFGASPTYAELLENFADGNEEVTTCLNQELVQGRGVMGPDGHSRDYKVLYDKVITCDQSKNQCVYFRKYIPLGGAYCNYVDNLSTDLTHATSGQLFFMAVSNLASASTAAPKLNVIGHLQWTE